MTSPTAGPLGLQRRSNDQECTSDFAAALVSRKLRPYYANGPARRVAQYFRQENRMALYRTGPFKGVDVQDPFARAVLNQSPVIAEVGAIAWPAGLAPTPAA